MGYFTRLILRWIYMSLVTLGIAMNDDLNLFLNDPDLILWTNTFLGFVLFLLTEGWYLLREKIYNKFKSFWK